MPLKKVCWGFDWVCDHLSKRRKGGAMGLKEI